MKHLLLAVCTLSLLFAGCSVPFSDRAETIEASAGETAAGAAGSPADAGTAGKLSTGHGGSKGGSAGAPAAGTGGSVTVGAGGSSAEAGAPETAGTGGSTGGSSAGTAGSPAAGAPTAGGSSVGGMTGSGGSSAGSGTAGTGTIAPSCTSTEAFSKAPSPSGTLKIAAWTSSFAQDNICWKQDTATCTFTVDTWGPSPTDSSRTRMMLKNINCSAPIYYGKPNGDACDTSGSCGSFDGSDASLVAVDFDLTPSGNGYVAANMEQKASNPGGSLVSCEVNQSEAANVLFVAAEDLLSSINFSCGQ